MTRRLVVLGTGTEIGKTHASVALVRALADLGFSVAGLKPIESGVTDGDTDAGQLKGVSTFHVKHPPYEFAEPVSPHLAARRARRAIHLPRVASWVSDHAAEVVVIESAGALLSPLSARTTNLDLACALLPAALVLVAPDRLGVLHDVTATLLALRGRLPRARPVVLLQPPAATDASTSQNAAELRRLRIAPRVVVFPRAAPTAPESLASAREALALLWPRLTPPAAARARVSSRG